MPSSIGQTRVWGINSFDKYAILDKVVGHSLSEERTVGIITICDLRHGGKRATDEDHRVKTETWSTLPLGDRTMPEIRRKLKVILSNQIRELQSKRDKTAERTIQVVIL